MDGYMKIMIQKGKDSDKIVISTNEKMMKSFNISIKEGFLVILNLKEQSRQQFEIEDFSIFNNRAAILTRNKGRNLDLYDLETKKLVKLH